MRIQETIDALAKSAPINIVWGPRCSSTSDEVGVNWAHICLAELVRARRIARILAAKSDTHIADVMNDAGLFPDFHETGLPDLDACAVPSVYLLGATGASAAANLIERGAQTGPWIVLGCSGNHFGLCEALSSVPRFEQGLWWIGFFDQPPPSQIGADYFSGERGAHFLSGFDPGSFMAYLTRGLAQFPPAFLPESGNGCASACAPIRPRPNQQLQTWVSDYNRRLQVAGSDRLPAARKMLEQAAGEHGDRYESLVAQAIRLFEMEMRKSRGWAHSHAVFVGNLADVRGPREATRLLHKALEWMEKDTAGDLPSAAEMEAMQLARAYAHLARFRTGPEARALFEKAEQALASVKPGILVVAVSIDRARLLAQWADQERDSESGKLFERAQQIFEYEVTAKRSKALKHLRFTYAQALVERAAAVPNRVAASLLVTARSQVELQLKDEANDVDCRMFLGRIALLEASSTPKNRPALEAEALGCFKKALAIEPGATGDIYTNWGAALCESAAPSGAHALDLLAEANERFRQAELASPDSARLHKNWSTCLIHEASKRVPGDMWQRAKEHAEKAEAIVAGAGAYNLACIAAELSDREGVRHWLNRSADYGKIPSLAYVLRDESFQKLREAPWFQEALAGIFI